ncbi:hypothetical protein SAMN02745213_01338 [Succinivibrio dextrinosolvens DSM 3072]|uniref:Uncharacterized protein n=1 Tax=Succinivibrio dextrinosolvens DSM 3072 TaxID=1123324 RepID=A0A1T4VDA0_9GAMM|nr:hypothetical protein [Succinivibrio dextrinosolvens]SKA62945.1 hypothetical protein SAMN02745213_01338 [Succinivibrio dextrinosolvens DSM 3072]
MSSLTEKDSLLEEVSATASFICYRFRFDAPKPREILRTEELSDFLYSASPDKINAEKIRKELEELKKPYLNKPVVLFDD